MREKLPERLQPETKGSDSRLATLAMAFELAESAQKRCRRFDGHKLISDMVAGITGLISATRLGFAVPVVRVAARKLIPDGFRRKGLVK